MRCCFGVGQTIQLDGKMFTINKIVGYGASSVVYQAVCEGSKGVRMQCILKEYNPDGISLHRDEFGMLCIDSEDDREKFESRRDRFEKGYTLQLKIRDEDGLTNATSNIQRIHHEYNTVFIEMTYVEGCSYDKAAPEQSLTELILRVQAIAKVISHYHENGYLHLDIKPANIFVPSGTRDSVMLFDFDSVVTKNAADDPRTLLSYSAHWAAPELKEKSLRAKVDTYTDLYAIGMVFFYKLMGRFPEELTEQRLDSEYVFDTSCELLKGAGEETLSRLTRIFRRTLCIPTRGRWKTAKELIAALDELLKSIDRPQVNQPAKENDSQDVKKQISKLNRTIIVAAVLVCILVASLMIGYIFPRDEHRIADEAVNNPMSSDAQEIVSDSNEQLLAEGAADAPPVDEENEAVSQTPEVSLGEINGENGQETEISSDISAPVVNEDAPTYMIDTLATGLNDFRSMVIDSSGVVYYINGETVYNSANSITIDLASDFDVPLENCYLAYDSYSDIVYLLAGGGLSIYDITDFNAPALVLDNNNCPDLLTVTLAYNSSVTPQIAVLGDGSLLIPADLDGTYRVNPETKLVTPFTKVYDLQSSYFAKVIGSDIVEMREESTDATIIPLTGGAEYSIQLERPAPYNNGNSVCSTSRGIFFYWENVGLCKYSIAGEFEIAVEQEKITVRDFQPLDNTNIWSITANESGCAAFYDNSLKCIRLIWCE